jgi:DNA-binding CsgD family transcriptional regulator
MKRHRALAPLSRDHHVALVAAQRLRRAAAADVVYARAAFLEFWHEHGAEHFRVEEEVLLPVAAGWTDPEAACIARMLVDHVRIRAAAQRLEREAEPALDELHHLGSALERHVRLREAHLTFERLRAEPWAALAAAELEATGIAVEAAGPPALAELTPHELRVASIVASGATNQETASRLFVTPKTVEYHLRSIYRKLGIRSRSELTRLYVAEQAAA